MMFNFTLKVVVKITKVPNPKPFISYLSAIQFDTSIKFNRYN